MTLIAKEMIRAHNSAGIWVQRLKRVYKMLFSEHHDHLTRVVGSFNIDIDAANHCLF